MNLNNYIVSAHGNFEYQFSIYFYSIILIDRMPVLFDGVSAAGSIIYPWETPEKPYNCGMTTIILVRHGQTEWNRFERFRGRADIPLDQTGLEQAAATGRRIASEWKPAAVYSSPLSRSVRTAESIAFQHGLPVQVEPGLVDIDYGEWQGLTSDEARQRWPQEISAWYNQPELAFIPGGETLDQLRARLMRTLDELLLRHPDATIVLVGHTVINRVILLAVLGLGNQRFWRLRQDTCAINVFQAEAGDFTLLSLNDTCHLRIH